MAGGRVRIHYCSQCHWLLRSSWYAQELLSTFSDELEEVALRPGTGGLFEIHANDVQIWERKRDGGFPDIVELKRRARDVICPDRPLGHLDRQP